MRATLRTPLGSPPTSVLPKLVEPTLTTYLGPLILGRGLMKTAAASQWAGRSHASRLIPWKPQSPEGTHLRDTPGARECRSTPPCLMSPGSLERRAQLPARRSSAFRVYLPRHFTCRDSLISACSASSDIVSVTDGHCLWPHRCSPARRHEDERRYVRGDDHQSRSCARAD